MRKQAPEFDYKTMIPNIMAKKRFLRKCLVQEYLKEYKKIVTSDATNRSETILLMKMSLIDWYYKGFREVVIEEAERTEFGIPLIVYSHRYSQSHDIC
jgi:hypothetical protein